MSEISATLLDSMGSDLTCVNAARVSFSKKSSWDMRCKSCNVTLPERHTREGLDKCTGLCNFKPELSERDTKLIRYLAKNKHISPFGHCFMSFHVKAPVFVSRQLVKHEYLRINEVSRRYVDSEPEFYQPDKWRGRAENVKQGSSDEDITDLRVQGFKVQTVDEGFGKHQHHSLCLYNDMLEAGISPELARVVLPQNMMTEWYWSGSLDAFAKMCRLRLDPHAQYESRLVAEQINEQAKKLYPVSWEALLGES